MSHAQIEVRTADGTCPAHVFTPVAAGPWPAVLMFMDGIGIRPALFAMAERLANAGYWTLLPDLFYRQGPYTPPDPRRMFADPEVRADWVKRYISTVTVEGVMRDTAALLEYVAGREDVRQPRVGTVGYCMSGRFSLAAAARFPERVVAAASYHGSNLANDAADSPHRMAPAILARVYVGGASEDPSFPEEQKLRLAEALREAGVVHTIETYPAKHGWVPADTPTHDAAAAERHWETLFKLFGDNL